VQVCVVGQWCDVDETAPYAVIVSASSGPTTLRATAFDVEGGRASVDVPVTVVDTPPSVQLTAPTPGSQISTGEPFAVSASASPNPSSGSPVEYVSFELRDSGGNVVDFAEDFEAPFSVSMTTFVDGTHIVSATATDANGLSSAPATVQVTAVTPSPVLQEGRFGSLAGWHT
jgi:chitinase